MVISIPSSIEIVLLKGIDEPSGTMVIRISRSSSTYSRVYHMVFSSLYADSSTSPFTSTWPTIKPSSPSTPKVTLPPASTLSHLPAMAALSWGVISYVIRYPSTSSNTFNFFRVVTYAFAVLHPSIPTRSPFPMGPTGAPSVSAGIWLSSVSVPWTDSDSTG